MTLVTDSTAPRIALVGATGVAGTTLIQLIEERGFRATGTADRHARAPRCRRYARGEGQVRARHRTLHENPLLLRRDGCPPPPRWQRPPTPRQLAHTTGEEAGRAGEGPVGHGCQPATSTLS